jgi:hypothetical protein
MVKKAVIIKEMKLALGPIANAIQKTGIEMFGFYDLNKLKNYDYLIFFYNKLPPYFETKAKVGWWMNDLKLPERLNQHKTKFDEIFLCNLEYKKNYSFFFQKPVYYMPQCGLDWENSEYRQINWDVLFIGNISSKQYHSNREEILNFIGNKYFLKIISGEKTTIDQKMLYKYSKYSLSISAPLSTVTSNRLYNILSAKGFALVSWFPNIEKLFTNHFHLCWFKTPQEAIEIIDYYNNHLEEYNSIKENGNKLYNKLHTAKCRLDNIFDILEKKETKFRGFINE